MQRKPEEGENAACNLQILSCSETLQAAVTLQLHGAGICVFGSDWDRGDTLLKFPEDGVCSQHVGCSSMNVG